MFPVFKNSLLNGAMRLLVNLFSVYSVTMNKKIVISLFFGFLKIKCLFTFAFYGHF